MIMPNKPFKPVRCNSILRADLISRAADRIVYIAPGITEIEVQAIAKKQDRLPAGAIQLFLDISASSFTAGFWGDLTPDRLVQLGLNLEQAREANGLRLGILFVDKVSWIFMPTPQSVEHEPGGIEPNCLELDEEATRLLWVSIISADGQTAQRRPTINEAALDKVQSEIIASGAIAPSQKLLVDLIRPMIKIIQFEVRGYKLTSHTIRLPREVIDLIGSSDKSINERINADWKMFSTKEEHELEDMQHRIESEIDALKKKHLVHLGHYGFGLLHADYKDFQSAWKELEDNRVVEFRTLICEKYQMMVNRSQELLKKLIKERIVKGTLVIPKQKTLFPISADEEIDLFINSVIGRVAWPKAEDILNKLVIKYREYDISERLLQDKEFIRLFESFFGKLEDIVSRVEAKPTKPAFDINGFSLN